MSKQKYILAIVLVVVGISLLPAPAAQGATITVTNLNDSGPGSLRQAIADGVHGDVIDISVAGTITLTTGELVINQNLTIEGPGADVLAIDGNGASRVINIAAGNVVIEGLTVKNGSTTGDGGGILNDLGTIVLIGVTIKGNTAVGKGAGLFNRIGAQVIESTISGNISGNDGGGIRNENLIAIFNSTISGNTGGKGGGIDNRTGAIVTMVNTTISNNTATEGGGINTTGVVQASNSIIAGNTSGGDCDGVVTSLGHNLDGDGTCNLTEVTDLLSTNPLLGPLQDNGGTTFTHALLPGSPAIDRVPVASCTLVTDQRGAARPEGAVCDIGAFEWTMIVAPLPGLSVWGAIGLALLFASLIGRRLSSAVLSRRP